MLGATQFGCPETFSLFFSLMGSPPSPLPPSLPLLLPHPSSLSHPLPFLPLYLHTCCGCLFYLEPAVGCGTHTPKCQLLPLKISPACASTFRCQESGHQNISPSELIIINTCQHTPGPFQAGVPVYIDCSLRYRLAPGLGRKLPAVRVSECSLCI